MIVIHGGARFRAEDRPRVEAAARVLHDSTQAENGLIHYGLSWAVDDPNQICLLEVWRDADAHKSHTQMPYVEAFRDLAAKLAVAPPAFSRYEATSI